MQDSDRAFPRRDDSTVDKADPFARIVGNKLGIYLPGHSSENAITSRCRVTDAGQTTWITQRYLSPRILSSTALPISLQS